jgi:nitroreductase
MNFDETVRGRRSIRCFEARDIPEEILRELFALSMHAPSSMNGQPWYFVVVRDMETKIRLADLKNESCPEEKNMYRADFLKGAPVIVTVCVDRKKSFGREIENAVLVTAILMLGAWERGLGSVYMSAYREGDPSLSEGIRNILNIPEGIDPVTLVPLGYPAETPAPKEIKPLDEVYFHDHFGRKPF